MSDNSKAEKIAAARKKLKQFQSKTKAETASNSTTTSVGTESSVNTNGNSVNDIQQIEVAPNQQQMPQFPIQQQQLQQQMQMQQPQTESTSLHFGAIDPIQFDSSRIFDLTSQTDTVFDVQSNNLEIGQQTVTPSSNNNVHYAAPPQTVTAQQPPIETFSQFSNFNQTNATSQQQQQQTMASAFSDIVQMNVMSNSSSNVTQSDQRNQELANLLQVEKVRNHELSVKVTQQHSTIEGLSKEIQQLRHGANAIQELQQQVAAHIQTVNILVGEKSDLNAKLQQKDQRITEYESECVELQGRLKASRHRVAELEKDLNTLTQSHQKYDGSQQALCAELESLQEENKRLKRLHQEACDENTEVQHQLASKAKEIDELKNVISSKNSELEMARVRLEQLTGGDLTQTNDLPNVDQSQKDQRLLDSERQIIELQNMISELTNDRDRTQQQYQTYVQHLTNETTTMTQRIQELTKTNEKLSKREESLVNHVQELEKQIQKQISTQRRLAALRDEELVGSSDDTSKDGAVSNSSQPKDDIKSMQEKLNAIEKEKSDLNALLQDQNTQKMTLQQQLLEKDAKLTEIESELERLRAERPDASNLLASIESDKVAASRAMTQNQELRQQLEEMQHAYVQVSNDKLELTDQLQSEEFKNRDVRTRFSDLENELKSIKEKLHFKDEEMIRLTHENSQFDGKIQELTKKLNANSNDSVRQVIELQKKLHAANKEIKRIRAQFQEGSKAEGDEITTNVDESLVSIEAVEQHSHDHEHGHTHDHSHEHTHDHSHDHCNHNHNANTSYEDGNDETKSAIEALENSDVVSVSSTINIATNEAMDKLQQRFKRTMNEIADLTEEKHRLEHLVTQLQSETETIGEYIALYQTQRRLLKQREIEKDIQLNRIAADREDMRDKLRQLNELVELLLTQKGFSNAKEIMAQLHSSNNNSETVPENAEAVNGTADSTDAVTSESGDKMPIVNNCHVDSNNSEHEHEHVNTALQEQINQTVNDANTRETATKIINLLTDIKDKNLRQDYTITPNNVDHCPCCSGKLEVV